ncbi:hypothetical protein A2533_03565 [Candidatus Falkowbacteria bacterium RIFOXYD2_FULL_35_9]|uniref:Thioredoxin domain-containing protein n=1 Tax=Candidatus Falkowbacteria bacterium RIFOXYC2_FULL_36_12 TaxID=1798002 RepID=A0A1F5T0C4_9BACT|nr:MAG: hypothetical protein A2300_01485 [Candidatus Falkowbacteria bacterium RIFOXYB2_FULL_35_7]OGF32407.1 MAG: hypothetical protein A2478_03750 [Candidatus Falkowbacteria bacterium RIFOXYC2_FULL_36_12]OGF34019.1 MAG: hypothetical protein A2223_03825 [Candidatus Falkowbacteria bacterium RIFOXYA2_FULL_35_8]OGF47386.1 MAG: hypothetical protein A2533_03565 [Candidatus Falkowbacteria bacterium RIFOXYD2_FULL_35_9]
MIVANMKFENFQLKNPDKSEFDLYNYLGENKGIIIFFRSTWCSFCKRQLADFQNHYDDFVQAGVKIIAISNDTELKTSLLQNFLYLKFPLLSDINSELIKKYNLSTTYKDELVSKPAIFIIDQEKNIKNTFISEDYDNVLSAKIILAKV